MGAASMVTGILSLLFSFIPGVGIVLGVIAIALARKDEDGNMHGMAIAGLVCGIVGLCICVIVTGVAVCAGVMVA